MPAEAVLQLPTLMLSWVTPNHREEGQDLSLPLWSRVLFQTLGPLVGELSSLVLPSVGVLVLNSKAESCAGFHALRAA